MVSRNSIFDEIGYKPHSQGQWDAHNSTVKFKIPCCGRRWGKTTFAANELTFQMFAPEKVFWIVAPSYSVGEKEFRVVYDNFIRKMPAISKTKGFKANYSVVQGNMRIELPWNTILEVKSADRQDSLLGEGLDGVIMSEAATHEMKTWQQFIEPALSDKKGWAIFPSTPRGYNWYHALFEMGQLAEFPDFKSWTFPTWSNVAMYPLGLNDPDLLRIKATATKAYWEQEYAAKFTAFEGQIYESFDRDIHVTDIAYNPDWENYQTFDFGFKDPFVCLDIMVDPDDNVYVWREYQVSGKTTWEHGQYLTNPFNPDGYRENPPGYHVDGRYADPSNPDGISTLESCMGRIEATRVPWENGIETIGRWLKPRVNDGKPSLFFDRKCVRTVNQIEQLRHKFVKEGKNEGVVGQHDFDDHGPDALRYFFGPHFFLRLNAHLSDVYGTGARGTESEAFFKLQQGFTRSGDFIKA